MDNLSGAGSPASVDAARLRHAERLNGILFEIVHTLEADGTAASTVGLLSKGDQAVLAAFMSDEYTNRSYHG